MKSNKLGFQGGSISEYDWEGMLPCLKGVKTLLEFGAGISTLLFRKQGLEVTTVETSLEWKEAVLREAPDANVQLWDNSQLPNEIAGDKFDMVFVDGLDPRDRQIHYAARVSDRILLHDGGRADVAGMIDEQLGSDWKEIPISGRTRFFIKQYVWPEGTDKQKSTTPCHVKNRYGAVTSCTDNYKQYLNGLLNSMDAQGLVIDLHVVVIDVNEKYLEQIESADWCFNLILHRFTENEIHEEIGECKRFDAQLIRYRIDETLYSKKSRYRALARIYQDYDVMMMLDADMLIVGDILPFFDMVSGTDIILGVNERFKWPLNSFDPLDGEEFPKVPMHWMICNAPTWFCPAKHDKFIKEADYCSRNLRQKQSVCSDLFTLNVAIWRAGATDRVVQLPFHCWTGTHNGYIQMFTHLQKINGDWIAISGDPVYILHGRYDMKNWERGFISEQYKRWNEIDLGDRMRKVDEARFTKIFRLMEKEFHHYNSECKVRL